MSERESPGLSGLLSELKRRHVFRVAIVYCLVAWGVIQVVTQIFPYLEIPDMVTKVVIVLAIVGFPLAVTLGWAFDLTPQGLQRTPTAEPPAPGSPPAPAPAVIPVRHIFPRLARTRPAAEHSAHAAAEPEPSPLPEALPPDPQRERRAALATLRHELRTPLNAILGYSEMLVEEAGDQMPREQLARLQGIHDSGRDLLSRIDGTLKESALQSGATLDELRMALHQSLAAPAAALAERSAAVLAQLRAADEAELADDGERIADAAVRLATMVEELRRSPGEQTADTATALFVQTREVTERFMARIRPTPSPAPLPPRHAHLLVVDDNAMNRDLLSRQLTRQGYTVSTAGDGVEALRQLALHRFDLVLLDVLMPQLDGIQVLDRMRRDPAVADIPVIMISALDEMDGVVRCIQKGAADCLSKPFDPVLLQARIGATLEARRLRDEQRRTAEQLAEALAWSDRLARSLLPVTVAERLERGQGECVEAYPEIMVLALEVTGADLVAARGGEEKLAEGLRELYAAIERALAQHPVEAVWINGCTLLCFAGTTSAPGDHAAAVAEVALRVAEALAGGASGLRVGMGVHSGAAVASLIGSERLVYGVWGDAVEVAAALGRGAAEGEVLVSPAAHARLFDGYTFDARGVVEVGGRGRMRIHRLTGSRAAAPAG